MKNFTDLVDLGALSPPGRYPAVHFFLLDDMPDEAFALARRLLSAAEKKRADRLRVPSRRKEFTIARAILRSCLGAASGVEPVEIAFTVGAHGKPRLASPSAEFGFNISHSRGAVALALVRGREVGIDVEKIRTDIRAEALAARFFSKRENERLSRLSGTEMLTAFFDCWTRKEAVLKAIGAGLSLSLASFDVSLDPDRAELLATRWEENHQITLQHLDAPEGYRAALAIREMGREVQLTE
jgi:4'-phosphopantetheinyl transferase